MLTGSFIVATLAIAAVIGGAISAYLWLVRRKRLHTTNGIAALAAMRWREFSQFVVEALHTQGYEADLAQASALRGQEADMIVTRGGQRWVLSCKQAPNQRITPAIANELAKNVRLNGATGGILASLGTIAPDTRKRAEGIELLDGVTLWPLIDPLLPPSLHDDLAAKARTNTVRMTAAAWVLALLASPALAMLLGQGQATSETTAIPAASTAAKAAPQPQAPPPSAPAAMPLAAPTAAAAPTPTAKSDVEQRKDVINSVTALPGVAQAIWSTRSTLLVQLVDDSGAERKNEICAVLGRHPDLRTSRLHLQPPAGSEMKPRFLQCQTY